MFRYTVIDTESESDIQNSNLLYKTHPQCQNTFEHLEHLEAWKYQKFSSYFVLYIISIIHILYFCIFGVIYIYIYSFPVYISFYLMF